MKIDVPFKNFLYSPKNKIDKKYLGVSKAMRVYIDTVIAGEIFEEKEIQFLRRKAESFGDDPDEVEIAARAEIVRLRETKTETNMLQEPLEEKPEKVIIEVKPDKNIFGYTWNVLKHYRGFKGRARRAEFWQYILMILIVLTILFIIIGFTNFNDTGWIIIGLVLFLLPLGLLLPFINVWVRRIHDTNKPAWFILIPLYNLILLFVPGTKDDNKYGPDPKKIIIKEIYVKSRNEARIAIKNAVKQEKMAKLWEYTQVVGATLFTFGGSLYQMINNGWLHRENFTSVTTVVWVSGGILLVLPKLIGWIIKIRNNTKI